MAGLIYFVPERFLTHFDAATLAELRLTHAFEPATPQNCREFRGTGPGDAQGGTLLFDDHVPVSRARYEPESQTWRRVIGSPCWVGFLNDARPTPADLARAEQIPGALLRLDDGQEWLVPTIRGLSESEAGELVRFDGVDRKIDWDDDGNRILGDVVPEHRPLLDAVEAWFDARYAQTFDEEISQNDLNAKFNEAVKHDSAVTLLAANYRIGRTECGLLGMFRGKSEVDILDASVCWPLFMAWLEKKSSADGSDSADGPSDATQDSARP